MLKYLLILLLLTQPAYAKEEVDNMNAAKTTIHIRKNKELKYRRKVQENKLLDCLSKITAGATVPCTELPKLPKPQK